MIWNLDPSQTATCAMCREAPARYFRASGEGGCCRPCVEAMPVEERLRTLQGLEPADRRLWEIDKLARFDQRDSRGGESRGPRPRPHPAPAGTSAPPRGQAPQTSPRLSQPERRKHPRVEARFPVGVSLSTVSSSGRLRPRRLHSMSKDISAGGIRIPFRDPELLSLPAGAPLRLELLLPRPPVILRCGGLVRSVVVTGRTAEAGDLCVAFRDLGPTQGADLQAFVSSSARPLR